MPAQQGDEKMKAKPSLTGLLTAAIALLGMTAADPIHAEEITVASWGGAYQTSQREAYFKPYAKEAGVTVLEDEWSGELSQIRVQVETGNYKWHVVDVETDHVLAGCDEGILEPIDYGMLGGTDAFLPGTTHECAVGTISWATVYAYDADVWPEGNRPTTMADFFDVKKFPGKRGMYKSPKFNLEFALIADGVAAKDVNQVLAAPGGVERAFAKLETIKDQVVWWEAGAQAPQLLADKEVVMTTAWNGRIYDAVKKEGKNFVIVWDGQGIDYDWWVIPKGHPAKDAAMKFIAFASRPEVMANQSKYISYGPTLKAVIPLVGADVLPHLPTAPENTKNAYSISGEWWGDHREELTERFNAWIAQ
jgi:putative spermidine/putrescine transport system substrate-binding protein